MCPDDNTLSAFLEGTLDAAASAELKGHLAGCASCRALVAKGAAPVLATGARVEHYVVLHEVGAGAMGVVFAAWDNRLDRRVALKVLHAGSEADRHERLAREARALARLSHPNVVAVYDVGRSVEGVYVAMEFVDGQNVRQWLKTPRAPSEVLSVFTQAAKGLGAAHAAGLVHRDFKPDNVLIGSDGRARVSDFGLAQLKGAAAPAAAPFEVTAATLTRTGTVLGTPAYMAPEVLDGGAADARADQFAFCTALWEALTGSRPFSGMSSDELKARIVERRFEAAKVRPPRRLERALKRGLSANPEERFPSMEALLHELAPRAVASSRLVLSATALLAVGGAASFSWWRASADDCAGSQVELQRLWGEAQQRSLRGAFSGPELASVEQLLTAWTARWADARTEACRATQRKEQSEALLDKRMQCFAAQATEARALIAVLAEPAARARAVEAVAALPVPEACSAARVEQRVQSSDPVRARGLEEELSRVRAQAQAGRFAEARDAARALVEKAKVPGVEAVFAGALNLLGQLLERTNEFVEAETTLIAAAKAAQAARDDEAAVVSLCQLAYVSGVRRSKMEQGLEWVELARGALARLGGSARLEAEVEASHAAVLKEAGRLAEALEHQARRATLLESLGAEGRPPLAQSLAMRGRLLTELARFDEARAALEQALKLQTELLGGEHPDVAVTLNHLGMTCRRAGDMDCAVKQLERALAIGRKALGPEALEVGYTLNHLGNVYAARGQWPKALETFLEVLRIGEATLGPEHHEVGMAHSNLCWAYRWLRRVDDARRECDRAREIVEAKLGPEHGYVAEVLHQVATVTRLEGRCADALVLERRALAAAEKVLGAEHAQLADPLTGIGLCELELRHRPEAEAALERALRLRKAVTLAETGETRLGLARALAEGEARACELATLAVDELRRGGAVEAEWRLAPRCR